MNSPPQGSNKILLQREKIKSDIIVEYFVTYDDIQLENRHHLHAIHIIQIDNRELTDLKASVCVNAVREGPRAILGVIVICYSIQE